LKHFKKKNNKRKQQINMARKTSSHRTLLGLFVKLVIPTRPSHRRLHDENVVNQVKGIPYLHDPDHEENIHTPNLIEMTFHAHSLQMHPCQHHDNHHRHHQMYSLIRPKNVHRVSLKV
jgi:hypothetical protein